MSGLSLTHIVRSLVILSARASLGSPTHPLASPSLPLGICALIVGVDWVFHGDMTQWSESLWQSVLHLQAGGAQGGNRCIHGSARVLLGNLGSNWNHKWIFCTSFAPMSSSICRWIQSFSWIESALHAMHALCIF